MSLITVNNKYIGPVKWEDKGSCEYNLNEYIHVWQIDIQENLPHIEELWDVLTSDEVTRANKYLKSTHRDKFIISRGLLRHILSGYLKCQPAGIRFKLTGNNKPVIDHLSGATLHFNLSDSADKVLIAVATTPIGIDIELINPKFNFDDILNNNFSLDEAGYIGADDSCKRFFLLWTRKEAILKATGIGLTDHLRLVPSLNGQHVMEGDLIGAQSDLYLNSFQIDDNYMASIAMNTPKMLFKLQIFYL